MKNLMLRRDVVEAVEAGRFQVHAVEDVDQAMEILTGREAGGRDAERQFRKGSLNQLVEARLMAFASDARDVLARGPPPAPSSGR